MLCVLVSLSIVRGLQIRYCSLVYASVQHGSHYAGGQLCSMKHLQGVALCMHGAGVGILHALRLGPELSQLAVSHVLAPFGVNFRSIQPCKCLYVTSTSLQCWVVLL